MKTLYEFCNARFIKRVCTDQTPWYLKPPTQEEIISEVLRPFSYDREPNWMVSYDGVNWQNLHADPDIDDVSDIPYGEIEKLI